MIVLTHPQFNLIPHSYNITARYYEGWNFDSGNYLFTTDTK